MIFKIVSIVGALICVVLLLVYLIDNSKWYIKWKHLRDLQHNHPEVFDINNYTLWFDNDDSEQLWHLAYTNSLTSHGTVLFVQENICVHIPTIWNPMFSTYEIHELILPNIVKCMKRITQGLDK